jgi:bla regulator protein BlaR1
MSISSPPIEPSSISLAYGSRSDGVYETRSSSLSFAAEVGGEPIVDKTGLTAYFDVNDLEWTELTAVQGTGDGANAPSLFTALQEKLGLKLVPAKAPLEVVVIDSIERPSAN